MLIQPEKDALYMEMPLVTSFTKSKITYSVS